MPIPNAEHADVDIERLRTYIPNPEHHEGRHKALVFESALGLTMNDAEFLMAILLEKIQSEEAKIGKTDQYGTRFRVDFEMTSKVGSARVRSAWIVRTDTLFPQFLTCYVID